MNKTGVQEQKMFTLSALFVAALGRVNFNDVTLKEPAQKGQNL